MPYEVNGIRISKKTHTACVFLTGELLESCMVYRTAHGHPRSQPVISHPVTEVWPSVQVHLLGDNEHTKWENKITRTVPNDCCFNYCMLPTVEKVQHHTFLTQWMYIIRLQWRKQWSVTQLYLTCGLEYKEMHKNFKNCKLFIWRPTNFLYH
jgi:hypothetical protein